MRHRNREVWRQEVRIVLHTMEARPKIVRPESWTPAHVGQRMIEAFQVLRIVGKYPLPSVEFGSNWPEMLRVWADINDLLAYAVFQRQQNVVPKKPSREEINRMDEALAWPLQFLKGQPLAADALNVWAACKANHEKISDVLEQRHDLVMPKVRRRQEDFDQDYDRKKQEAVTRATSWANSHLEKYEDKKSARERIEANAVIRLERALSKIHRPMVKPVDLLPDKVMSRTSLDRHRLAGAKIISENLIEQGREVR